MSAVGHPPAVSRRRHSLNWGISLGLLLLLGLATELLLQQYALRQHQAAQQRLTASAGEVRAVFLGELNATLHLATGLASYITANHGQLREAELQPWLQGLLRQGRHIRNIGLAPDNRITYVYPLAGNEAVLGLYYPDRALQWPAVQRIIASRRPGLDGPLQLIQGGSGLIYRVPVFLPDRRYWGLISTVIDFDQLYAQVEATAAQLNLHIRLARVDAAAAPLPSAAEVHGAPRVTLEAPIAGARWRLEAGELAPQRVQLGWPRLFGWSLALAVSALIAFTLHAQHRRAALLLAFNQSQRQFRRAFELAPQGLALLDASGRLLTVNQTLCQLLQRSPQALRGQPLGQFCEAPLDVRLDAELAELGSGPARQLRLLDAQGEAVDVELSAATLGDPADGVGSVRILHIQDIRE
ncbi:PAS domain-containing protein, partial [Pseudomonas sp. CrR25]|nr:PAS domain-containing protein [Pseudomonas sp. CrR25]